MSIEINYKGRIGNHLFQYCFARMLAQKNSYKLLSQWDYPELMRSTVHDGGKVVDDPIWYIKDTLPFDELYIKNYDLLDFFNKPLKDYRYIVSGYFENSDFFNSNEELIKSFFKIDYSNDEFPNDIVINLRLGDDFAELGRIIHPEYYTNILERETFDKVYIVGANENEPYLKVFEKYKPIIVPNNVHQDFHFIRKFNKIVCSNSTYSWWAAFLSNASIIYTPEFNSPFLRSCRNSIVVEVKYLKDYKPVTQYEVSQSLFVKLEKLLVKKVQNLRRRFK